jgi:hypothetical protein
VQVSIDSVTAWLARVGDGSTVQHAAQEYHTLQLLSSVEICLNRMSCSPPADVNAAAAQVQLLCLTCMEAEARTAVNSHSPMQKPSFQAAAMLLQRALEASSKSYARSFLQRVLTDLDAASRRGTGAVYACLAALLLLLECSHPSVRRVVKKHALAVFSRVLACVHSNSMAAGQWPHCDPITHAANSLALRCIESMVAQKRDFRSLGPVLHQITACVSASTNTLLSQVQAASTVVAAAMPVAGGLQIIGGCCSLITALMRHRSESAEAVVATTPWLSQQWMWYLQTLASASDVKESERYELRALKSSVFIVVCLRACV